MSHENPLDAEQIHGLDNFYASLRDACAEMGYPWDERTRKTFGLLAINFGETIRLGVDQDLDPWVILGSLGNACYYIAREGVPPEERA